MSAKVISEFIEYARFLRFPVNYEALLLLAW